MRLDDESAFEEPSVGSPGEERQRMQQFLAHYGAPAFVRRARRLQDAFDALIGRCRHEREERLAMVRTRLAMLYALAGDWSRIRPLVADDEQVDRLEAMYHSLRPALRAPLEPTSSTRALARGLRELASSIERFNRGWLEFIRKIDLAAINELREGYNRYYLLEKECAVRSPRLAKLGFSRLDPLTAEELTALLPLLPVPRLKA